MAKNFRSTEGNEMYNAAGFRERYAMVNGNKSTVYVNGHKCYKFTYSKTMGYQGGNGALYDTVEKRWRT